MCTLVLIGVRADRRKELIALSDGHRESCESWADLLRDARRRGMRAPVLAVGDGALGFWAALREVFPETAEQCDWVHKVANVLDALPKSAQTAARTALAEIRDAEDKPHARTAMKLFADTFTAKFPKVVAKITGLGHSQKRPKMTQLHATLPPTPHPAPCAIEPPRCV